VTIGPAVVGPGPCLHRRRGRARARRRPGGLASAARSNRYRIAMTRISILMPVFNEVEYVATVVARVLAVRFGDDVETEIVAVDDGSTDGSAEALEELGRLYPGRLQCLKHPANRGKGAAIRTAIAHATGEFAVIQDSDLEYNPNDLPNVLRPLLNGYADAVFGSRFMVAGERRVLYFWHSLANHVLTTCCNAVADLNLTDVSTGYKAFRLSLIRSIPIRSDGFGIEPELAIKLAQRGAALYEAPISYRGRTYAEGKKIRRSDALRTLWSIVSFGIRRDIYLDRGARTLDALAQTPRFNAWMASIIRGFLGTHVLEIGAGVGNLTQFLCPRRKTYTATDIDPEHLARLAVSFQNRPNVRISVATYRMPRTLRTSKAHSIRWCASMFWSISRTIARASGTYGTRWRQEAGP